MRFAPLFLALAAMVQAEVHTESDTPNAAFAAPDPSLPLTNWPQSGINTPEGYEPGTGPGCNYCTIPVGYSNLDVGAPLGVEKQFTRSWQRAHRKAKNMLDGWSLEDKVNLVTGVGWMQGRCVGNIREINDFPGFCLQDSLLGVRFADRVSAFPAAINVAVTFDKSLMYKRGKAMGAEFRGKGIHVALGPMTNMGRVAAGGRNWEGFGGDPYLSGHGTQHTIWGLQSEGVQATVKLYLGNEQERNRTTSSSNLDDRAMHEVYAHPFLRAVQANVASVMCSYNLVNGSWACQNPQLLNGLLKTDYGFGGYVMSDWNGQMSGVLSANTGLDMSMPGDIGMDGGKTSYWGPALVEAVKNGSVSAARMDDMAQRVLAAWYLTGQDKDFPPVNFNSWAVGGELNEQINVQGDHKDVIREIGGASAVLLKNDGAIPLKAPRTIAVIGSDMGPAHNGPNGCGDHGCLDGTLAMGWGSGTTQFPYLIDPLAALVERAAEDGSSINWSLDDWDTARAASTAANSNVAIVGIASDSGEGYITVDGNEGDRNNLSAWHNGDELVKAVAGANANTVVVVHSVGPMDVEVWIEHPNVTAVVWAGVPGQESGNALVDVLYGVVNPSGRLPYTIAKNINDYPAHIDYVNRSPPLEPQVEYTEKLNIDYRHFLANDIEPRFGFGYGLSYTTFEYSDINIGSSGKKHGKRGDAQRSFQAVDESMVDDVHNPSDGILAEGDTSITTEGDTTILGDGSDSSALPTFGEHEGGHTRIGTQNSPKLHRARWTVTATVSNTGKATGWAVPQLYISYPEGSGEPPRVFRDFERVRLRKGKSQKVKFELSAYDVSVWDVVKQKWVIPEGEFIARVADNAFDEGVTATWTPQV